VKRRRWRIQEGHAHEFLQDWERKERLAEVETLEVEVIGGEEWGTTDEERLETSWVSKARYV